MTSVDTKTGKIHCGDIGKQLGHFNPSTHSPMPEEKDRGTLQFCVVVPVPPTLPQKQNVDGYNKLIKETWKINIQSIHPSINCWITSNWV